MKNMSSRYKIIATIFIIFILTFSVSILLGWLMQIDELKGRILGSVPVNPITALSFILLSISFILSVSPHTRLNTWGKAIGLLVCLIGSLRLIEILFNIPTSISETLFAPQLKMDRSYGKPNSMAPNTAFLFVLTGLSLRFYSSLAKRKQLFADGLALLSLLMASLSIIGYLYGSPEFYIIRSIFPMSLSTAICFCVYCLALLFQRSDAGLMKGLASSYQGGKIARFLLPFAIVVPVAAGGLSLLGQSAGLFSANYGTALFTMVTVVLLVLVIWQSAISINRSSESLMHEVETTKSLGNQLRSEQQKAFEQTLLVAKMNLNKQLIEATINGQEKEKKQMGMELHDHINQILASTKLYLEMAKTDEAMRTILLDKSVEQITFAINEIRNLSRSMVLHCESKSGIYQQMIEMVNHITRSGGLNILFKISESLLNQQAPNKQVAIYRIVEEQLNNILKHARANRAIVSLEEEENMLTLSVEDDGRGFDPSLKRMGIGLSNIKSRTEMLNGNLKISAFPGKGCSLKITFPRANEKNQVYSPVDQILETPV